MFVTTQAETWREVKEEEKAFQEGGISTELATKTRAQSAAGRLVYCDVSLR